MNDEETMELRERLGKEVDALFIRAAIISLVTICSVFGGLYLLCH